MEQNEKNGMAIASLVIGIIAFLGSCCYGGVLGIVGLVLGIVALKKGNGNGKGLAIAGIVLSSLSILVTVAVVVMGVAMMGTPEFQEALKQAQTQQLN
ncbi:MAG: DUF4190 domain-containing protein [Eubacteriales bacterium]|nr:DUF4190 domain-containing protein [Eubacteriales bacterium]